MNDLKHHDDGLSPTARAALASLRADDDLPDEVRARMWAKISTAQGPVLSDMSGRTGRRIAPLLFGLAIAAGLALALVNLGRGAQELAAAPRADAAVYGGGGPGAPQPVRAGDRVPAAETVIAVTEPALVIEPEVAPRVVARERREPEVRGEAPVPGDSSTLAAETALLQRAQSALASGDAAGALARLGEHARGFAGGVLERERDALRVMALCAAGRHAEGKAAAAVFLREHSSSLLAERVRGACVTP